MNNSNSQSTENFPNTDLLETAKKRKKTDKFKGKNEISKKTKTK